MTSLCSTGVHIILVAHHESQASVLEVCFHVLCPPSAEYSLSLDTATEGTRIAHAVHEATDIIVRF